jgi:hypothetical protein
MKDIVILLFLVALLALAACTPAGEGAAVAPPEGLEQIDLVAGGGDLSLQGKLALGIVQLEETDMAVTEAQATELLPLWQALLTLSNSDTTADAELEAVVRQIQKAITPEQLQAIDAMELTADSLAALQESGALVIGFNQAIPADAAGGGTRPQFGGGAPPPGDFVVLGGPGGGPGGGPAGGAGADLSEDDLATRQAEFANIDPAEMQERMLTGIVVRLLQTKTGEAPDRSGFAAFEAILDAVSEATGLSATDVQAQVSEGKTLAQVIEDAGGDMAAVRAAAIEAIQALPDGQDIDAGEMVDRLLSQATQPIPQGTPAP